MLTQAQIANRLGDHFVLSPYGPQGFLEKLASLGLRVIEDRLGPSDSEDGRDAGPLIEAMASYAHQAWLEAQLEQGTSSRVAAWGEEFMVPFGQLSERGQEFDRVIMRAILAAISDTGHVVIEDQPDHIAVFRPDGWQIQHSVECRISGKLLDCEIHKAVVADTRDGQPPWVSNGRYRVSLNEEGDGYYERIEDAVG